MNYRDGQVIYLGDIVELEMPDGIEIAKVVMLGETYNYLDIKQSFKDWVNRERILKSDSIVVEWINKNPLSHNNPKYASVGNYMFTGISEDIKLKQRAAHEKIT